MEALEFANLSKSYAGGVQALDNVNLKGHPR